jgi:hypothetical protein
MKSGGKVVPFFPCLIWILQCLFGPVRRMVAGVGSGVDADLVLEKNTTD